MILPALNPHVEISQLAMFDSQMPCWIKHDFAKTHTIFFLLRSSEDHPADSFGFLIPSLVRSPIYKWMNQLWLLPSGKRTNITNWKDPPCLMAKSTISTGPFSMSLFVCLPGRVSHQRQHPSPMIQHPSDRAGRALPSESCFTWRQVKSARQNPEKWISTM